VEHSITLAQRRQRITGQLTGLIKPVFP